MTDYNDTINWLLEDNFPLVKYNTLCFILDKNEHDPEVQESLEAMLKTSPIGNILRKQNPDGGFFQEKWLSRHREELVRYGYLPKYKATIWQVRFLGEAEVPKEDPRIRKLGEYVLKNSYSRERGFFQDDLACVNADMVWALCKFGFEDNPKVKRAFDLQVKYQRFDDGDWTPPKGWPYFGLNGHCYGPNSCITGIIHFLRTLTVVPDFFWSEDAKVAKENAIEFFLRHGVIDRKWIQAFRRSLPSYNESRIYPRLEFMSPHTYRHDVIEVITNLLKLGVKASLLEKPIDFVSSKQTDNRRWILEATKRPMYGSWGKVGEENKWVTYRVMRLLKLAGRLDI